MTVPSRGSALRSGIFQVESLHCRLRSALLDVRERGYPVEDLTT